MDGPIPDRRPYWVRARNQALADTKAWVKEHFYAEFGVAAIPALVAWLIQYEASGGLSMTEALVSLAFGLSGWLVTATFAFVYYLTRAPAKLQQGAEMTIRDLKTELSILKRRLNAKPMRLIFDESECHLTIYRQYRDREKTDPYDTVELIVRFVIENAGDIDRATKPFGLELRDGAGLIHENDFVFGVILAEESGNKHVTIAKDHGVTVPAAGLSPYIRLRLRRTLLDAKRDKLDADCCVHLVFNAVGQSPIRYVFEVDDWSGALSGTVRPRAIRAIEEPL